MSQIKKLFSIADRLFLVISDKFHLVFEDGQYVVGNKNAGICHILEISLIGAKNLTGNKIKDISAQLDVNEEFIYGFCDAFSNIESKKQSPDYNFGYRQGVLAKEECLLTK